MILSVTDITPQHVIYIPSALLLGPAAVIQLGYAIFVERRAALPLLHLLAPDLRELQVLMVHELSSLRFRLLGST